MDPNKPRHQYRKYLRSTPVAEGVDNDVHIPRTSRWRQDGAFRARNQRALNNIVGHDHTHVSHDGEHDDAAAPGATSDADGTCTASSECSDHEEER